jgi:hypothetical protein
MQMRKNQRALDAIARSPSVTPDDHLQRKLVTTLRSQYDGRRVEHILHDRLNHWLPTTSADFETALKNLQAIGKMAPPLLFFAALRTMCNAWNTSARFHKEVLKCRICCCSHGDDLKHYAECPTVLRYARARLPGLTISWKGFLLLERHGPEQVVGMAIVHDIIQAAINSLRHRQQFLDDEAASNELHARMKALDKKDRRIHNAITSLSRRESQEVVVGDCADQQPSKLLPTTSPGHTVCNALQFVQIMLWVIHGALTGQCGVIPTNQTKPTEL